MRNVLLIALLLACMAECPAALAQGRLGDRLRLRGAGDKAAKDSSADEESPANDNAPTGIIEPAAPADSAAYRRGVRAVNQAKWDDAITALTEAIQQDPKSAAAYSTRGLAYTMKDNFPAALADFDAALKIDSNNAVAHFNRGFAYYRKGDRDKAARRLLETIRIDPKYAAPTATAASSRPSRATTRKPSRTSTRRSSSTPRTRRPIPAAA